jgi:hypothetical protein
VRAERAGVGGEGYRFYLFLLEIMGKLISKIHLHTSVPWRDCEREREILSFQPGQTGDEC